MLNVDGTICQVGLGWEKAEEEEAQLNMPFPPISWPTQGSRPAQPAYPTTYHSAHLGLQQAGQPSPAKTFETVSQTGLSSVNHFPGILS